LVRPCPVCGSDKHEELYRQRFAEFAVGAVTTAYDVVACRDCGTCFASGLPGEGRFDEYYRTASKYDLSAVGAELSAFDVDRFRDEAAFIAANVVDKSLPVLDIGTATGDLLVALRDLGFSSLHGVEPSPAAARLARERHGLEVLTGNAAAAGAWDFKFSIVTLIAVLEHLVDPVSALRELSRLLRDDGALYLLVPDAARFTDHLNAPYQEFSVEHINYFTPASFRRLLAASGLEVKAERHTLVVLSDDATGPAIEVIARRATRQPPVRPDVDGVEHVREYIRRSALREEPILTLIEQFAADQRPIFVWGTGTNALHLLASSKLADCNIRAFIDSNPHYAGRDLSGRPVLAPGDISHVDAPILVASAVSQSAIASAARTRFGPDVPLLLMY
jgi:ubiquinone/menaquinone biosynthesis C-methylase UbiE